MKPCGGIFLQGATRAIAVADVITTIFAILFTIVGTTTAYREMNDPEMNGMIVNGTAGRGSRNFDFRVTSPMQTKWLVTLSISYFALYITYFVLAIVLFVGADKRCLKKCRIYLGAWVFLVLVAFGLLILHEYYLSANPYVIAASVCFHLYKMYSMWVVYEFTKEIRNMGDYNELMRNLNDDEIRQFELGDPNSAFVSSTAGTATATNTENATFQPFDRRFEICPDNLWIDDAVTLGKGQYGIVYRGILTLNNGSKKPVAVKTTQPNADILYFKALLAEVKMMSFLGPHVNIVNLLGAVTKDIRHRRLWIVVKLCCNGNLEGFLKRNRTQFLNFVVNDVIVVPECQDQDESPEVQVKVPDDYSNLTEFSTEDLLMFAHQIAKGMEFLASKKVIHGDLASRNVLLTSDNTVKITDFGLSRKMYDYCSYTKKQVTPLPWRFMAIESLQDLQFSTQSDVWAYGCTLWELFTLGAVPYAGLNWSLDFVDRLADQGLRLNKPQYATTELYQVMMKCWEKVPSQRPTFTELKGIFRAILARINPYDHADRNTIFSFHGE